MPPNEFEYIIHFRIRGFHPSGLFLLFRRMQHFTPTAGGEDTLPLKKGGMAVHVTKLSS